MNNDPSISRHDFTALTDAQLLAQCEVDTYRASGPGGQKRNKTSSAVRIRHLPSGLMVIAEESRSQHENRARALRRIRQAFYLQLREELSITQVSIESLADRAEIQAIMSRNGKLDVGRRDQRFWPAVGVVLDVLAHCQARTSDAAKALGVSTANLIAFLKLETKVWEQANHLRIRFGHKTLRT